MRSSTYTPTTPDGKVTPEAMTRSGCGEPINEEIIQDYPCGSEPGHSFRSSPLNIYAIGRDSAVVLYVEKGCPNFTWESDNAWATFETAETSVRYNTIASSTDEGQDTIVTVTDANGLEVTISVPYSGAPTCCEDVLIEFALQTDNDDLNSSHWPGEVVTFIDGGCPPFAWGVTGDGFSLDYEATNSRRNRLHGNNGASGPVVSVEDYCGTSLCWSPDFDFVIGHCKMCPNDILTVEVEKGKTNIAWSFVGAHSGWSAETPTADLDSLIRTTNATTESVTLRATDSCNNTADKTMLLSCAPKEVVQQFRKITDVGTIKLDICHMSENVYAAVAGGYIRTFTIDPVTGAVSVELANRQFTVNNVNAEKVVRVTATIVAVAWGEFAQGLIATFTIDLDTGVISEAVDSEQFIDDLVSDLDFIYIREDEIFGIAYCGGASSYYQQGWFTCVGIDGAGSVGTDFVHDHLFTEQFYGATPIGHHLVQGITMCKGATYDQDVAIAFEITDTNEGRIQTWDVSTGGIGANVESDLQLEATISNPDITAISENNDGYVVIYEVNPASSGRIKVYSQDEDNQITLEDTVSLSETRFPTIVHMQEDCFAACWAANGQWRFTTYLIDTLSDYDIRGMCILASGIVAFSSVNAQIIRCSDSIIATFCRVNASPYGGGVTSIKQYCQTL